MAKKKRVAAQVKTASAVTFFLGEEECAVEITDVYQIIRDAPVTKVPNVSEHVEGVVNLRGIVVPIVDLKHLLGLGVRTLGEGHRILIVEHAGRRVGFSVDSVGGVLIYEENRVQSAPEVVLAKVSGRYLKGVVQKGDAIVVLLELRELLASTDGGRRSRRWSRAEGVAASRALGPGSDGVDEGLAGLLKA